MGKLRVGLVQLNTNQNINANYAVYEQYLREAIAGGAQFILTPEVTNLITNNHNQRLLFAAEDENDRFIVLARELAKAHKVHILIGSLVFKSSSDKRCKNRSFLINDKGEISKYYDKIHMFDVNLSERESYKESDFYAPGANLALSKEVFGTVGMTICYDIRFPNLYTDLALHGANIITVPSAFTSLTGEKHWEVLLRSRAIETGAFIVAPAQVGKHGALQRESYGNSIVVAPGGEVRLNLGRHSGIGIVEIDLSESSQYRSKIPNLRKQVSYNKP